MGSTVRGGTPRQGLKVSSQNGNVDSTADKYPTGGGWTRRIHPQPEVSPEEVATGSTSPSGDPTDGDASTARRDAMSDYYPSHIRKDGAGMEEAGIVEEDERSDRVRLLVGR